PHGDVAIGDDAGDAAARLEHHDEPDAAGGHQLGRLADRRVAADRDRRHRHQLGERLGEVGVVLDLELVAPVVHAGRVPAVVPGGALGQPRRHAALHDHDTLLHGDPQPVALGERVGAQLLDDLRLDVAVGAPHRLTPGRLVTFAIPGVVVPGHRAHPG